MSAKKLAIAKDLSLPSDAVTSTLMTFGAKGMGKTNLGRTLIEQMNSAGLHWCVLDPLGVWWGLRHSADGKGPGIECLLVGGVHGDIPIEPTGGAIVADLVVDEDVDVIVDFSRDPSGRSWPKGKKVAFCTDFAVRLFERQGELVDRRRRPPLFVALDEAARYIPQQVRAGDKDIAMCVSAWEDLVEEGRNVGIGVGLFTQRSARINKSVSELADAMIAFRTVGPLSLDAIVDWLGAHVPKERIREAVETIRKLPVGAAYVVSPGWLDHEGVIHVRLAETFDSSATPKAGQRPRRVSGNAAVPDLAKYRERMAETIERAEAKDPTKLQRLLGERDKEIRRMREELVRAQEHPPAGGEGEPREVRVEVPVIEEAMVGRLSEETKQMREAAADLRAAAEAVQGAAGKLRGATEDLRAAADGRLVNAIDALDRTAEAIESAVKQARETPGPPRRPVARRPQKVVPRREPDGASKQAATSGDRATGDVTSSQQKILDALAWFEAMGLKEPTRQALAPMADTRSTSGGFKNNLGAMRSAGLLDYPTAGTVGLTDEGRSLAEASEVPLTNEGLQQAVFSKITASQRQLLKVLIACYPESLDREELAERADVPVTSGGFKNNLGALRTLGLIDYPGAGFVAAEPVLFPEER